MGDPGLVFETWGSCFKPLTLGEVPFIECRQFGPCSLCACLVVDLAAAHRPAVIAALIDLNRCLQMRCREGLFELVLGRRIALVVVVCDRAKNLGLHLRNQQVRAIRFVGYQATTVKGSSRSDALGCSSRSAKGGWAAHAVALDAHLFLLVRL